jgi:hypothetical protein
MASGHVNRIKRPNTWLHRPMLQNVKKALANSEPSTHGTKRTQLDLRRESVMRSRADIELDHAGIASNVCLTGKSANQCPALSAKIFRFTSAPNHFYIPRHPGPHRGAFRDRHERRAGDAMDASFVKRRMTLSADGEVVWS